MKVWGNMTVNRCSCIGCGCCEDGGVWSMSFNTPPRVRHCQLVLLVSLVHLHQHNCRRNSLDLHSPSSTHHKLLKTFSPSCSPRQETNTPMHHSVCRDLLLAHVLSTASASFTSQLCVLSGRPAFYHLLYPHCLYSRTRAVCPQLQVVRFTCESLQQTLGVDDFPASFRDCFCFGFS